MNQPASPPPALAGLSRVAAGRRERIAALCAWRQSLPAIPSPTEEEADLHGLRSFAECRDITIINGETFLVARDGTYQPVDTDPFRGLRAIAAGQALGLSKSHSIIEVKVGMITVTLVQPSRREAESIRAKVVEKLLATSTDGHFDSVAQKQRATKAEKQLAQRVIALRHVGDHAEDDWEVRNRVGVSVSEIRSV